MWNLNTTQFTNELRAGLINFHSTGEFVEVETESCPRGVSQTHTQKSIDKM